MAGGSDRGRASGFGPRLGLLIGVLAISTASTFIRLAQAEAHPIAVAAWRLTIASVLLAPVTAVLGRRELAGLSRRGWGLLAGAGVLLAVHFGAWVYSLAMTSVAASVVLVTTYPLFVGVASHLFLKERMTRRMVAGLLVAVAGSGVIGLGDWGAGGGGSHRLAGDGLALLGSVAVAGYFFIGRRLRSSMSLVAYVTPVYAVAAAALMAVAVGSGVTLTGYSWTVWLWLAMLALVPQIVGHSSLNWALRHLTATSVTIVVLAEPVGSTILAWLVLAERPTLWAVAGGAVVLLGIAIAGRSRSAPAAPPEL